MNRIKEFLVACFQVCAVVGIVTSMQFINTNSIEGFWSMVKRGIYGVYHWASAKHINKYLNEYSRKYNTKELTNSERFYSFFGNINHKITYKQLISA